MKEPVIDLLEAEELRKAIIGGEVDAFVVGRDDTNRKVLLLANAYQRYRQLVERMHQSAVTTSLQGGILYANQRFTALLGMPLARIYTAPLQNYVDIADRPRLSAFLARGGRADIEVTFNNADGTKIPARLTMADYDSYASILVTDLRPPAWAGLAMDALDSIRDSLEKLNAELRVEPHARQALDNIGEQINGLGQLIDSLQAGSGGSDSKKS